VEALLDKGKGYVTTILVQSGTLNLGDFILAGEHYGKIKAMFDERGKSIKVAGPSTPVSVLGLDGAPQAGDKFKIYLDEKEAKEIASKRSQLHREQSIRTQKHITLDEIGRRIALGGFKELNIILKGDVDGSVEALTDSLQKLSTEEIHVNIIHKGVGAITESDVHLASASDAIIIGFNVRPSINAKQLADKEEIAGTDLIMFPCDITSTCYRMENGAGDILFMLGSRATSITVRPRFSLRPPLSSPRNPMLLSSYSRNPWIRRP
jgi:translation initiation factor IF-2